MYWHNVVFPKYIEDLYENGFMHHIQVHILTVNLTVMIVILTELKWECVKSFIKFFPSK